VVNQTGPESSSPQFSPAKVILAVLGFVLAAIGLFWYTWVLIIAGLVFAILFLTG
jgi:hypothetical protein